MSSQQCNRLFSDVGCYLKSIRVLEQTEKPIVNNIPAKIKAVNIALLFPEIEKMSIKKRLMTAIIKAANPKAPALIPDDIINKKDIPNRIIFINNTGLLIFILHLFV